LLHPWAVEFTVAIDRPVDHAHRSQSRGRHPHRVEGQGADYPLILWADGQPFWFEISAPADRDGAVDIEANIEKYLSKHLPTDRYTSFDYCFNHFQSHREQGRIPALAAGSGMQLSCLHLGFYLASWGMYRGSAALLQRSLRQLAPVVEIIADAPQGVWEADADDYSDRVCVELLELAGRLRREFPKRPTDTLITKTMLGVFGCVPAFDQYVVKGSRLRTFNRSSLQ